MFNKSYFEKVFKKNDPWGYETSDYEKVKYDRQIDVLKTYYPQPKNILEIGCAEGLFTRMLAQTYSKASIISLDISSTAVYRARKNCESHENVFCIEADILDYCKNGELNPKTYDIIIQSESLYYLFPNLVKSMRLTRYLEDIIGALRSSGGFMTVNGLSMGIVPVMNLYYGILGKISDPAYKVKYREWNDFSKKHFTYDIRLFRAFP